MLIEVQAQRLALVSGVQLDALVVLDEAAHVVAGVRVATADVQGRLGRQVVPARQLLLVVERLAGCEVRLAPVRVRGVVAEERRRRGAEGGDCLV